ncbi:hypothetical protein [Cytobacillus firmus]|uniref:hypothetical protein n=1 Tax=Cytobacillus firmus TaxID=1399 RepID=UPI0030018E79
MWNSIVTYLTNDFLKFIGGFSLISGLVVASYFLFQKAAQHVFNRNVEKYKGQINQELEKLKLQHQKTLKDFELFTSKKHEKYPEMFLKLEKAIGSIMTIQGERKFYTFDNVNKDDLRIYFNDLNMTNFDQDRIFRLWEDEKETAKDEIRKLERKLKISNSRADWYDANDYFIYNQLFFSENVILVINNLLDSLYMYLENINIINEGHPLSPEEYRQYIKENKELKDKSIPENRKAVKNKMSSELSIGN